MSLGAMEWVWEHAQARGVARLVLLCIADRATGPDCTAYAGTTMLVRRTGAARSSVIRAVDKLTASGELEIVPNATGPRGETRYRLPHAVEYLRTVSAAAGGNGSKAGDLITLPVAESHRPSSASRGSTAPPERSHDATGRGSKTRPPHHREHNHQGDSSATAQKPRAETIPDAARPLVTALTAAGLGLSWRLTASEWAIVLAAEQRWGRETLVSVAVERTAGRDVRSARYLLAIWRDAANFGRGTSGGAELITAPEGNVVPLRSALVSSHTDNLRAGLALLEEQEEPR